MAVTVKFRITSEQPCQIPGIGEFKAGETKYLDDTTLHYFNALYGYPVGAGRYAPSVRCEAILLQDEEPKDEESKDAPEEEALEEDQEAEDQETDEDSEPEETEEA
jgi:hypothetical protein